MKQICEKIAYEYLLTKTKYGERAMIILGTFEDELSCIKRDYEHGSFLYENPVHSFCNTVANYFQTVRRGDKHGVYIVRQKLTNAVLYIGKGGTIDRNGDFKKQDIPTRLRNVKNRDLPADEWFKRLVIEEGGVIIEYIFLRTSPMSPAFVESLLLQAYYNEHKILPSRNNAF